MTDTDALAFLRLYADSLVGALESVSEMERANAAKQIVARVQGAGDALASTAGLTSSDLTQVLTQTVGTLGDLGHLSLAEANWLCHQLDPTPPAVLEARRVKQKEVLAAAAQLHAVVPIDQWLPPAYNGSRRLLTSLEIYANWIVLRYADTGLQFRTPNDLDAGYTELSWTVTDDAETRFDFAGSGSHMRDHGFGLGDVMWTPGPDSRATKVIIAGSTADGPFIVDVPLPPA